MIDYRMWWDEHKRKVSTYVVVVGSVLSIGYAAYAYLPMANGGGKSVTQKDVHAYRSALAALVKATGEGDIPSREDALKTLAVTYAQYELLKKNGILINQERTNQLIEGSSPLKGVLKEFRASMGDERYFFMITLPAAIGRPFSEFLSANDPKAVEARTLLQNAISTSLDTAASKAGLKVQDIVIQNNADSAALYEAASKSMGKPIDRIIDSGGGFFVIQPREKSDQKIMASAVAVQKTPAGEQFLSDIQKAGISLKVKPWCVYADNKFFAPQEPAKTAAAAPAAPAAPAK